MDASLNKRINLMMKLTSNLSWYLWRDAEDFWPNFERAEQSKEIEGRFI